MSSYVPNTPLPSSTSSGLGLRFAHWSEPSREPGEGLQDACGQAWMLGGHAAALCDGRVFHPRGREAAQAAVDAVLAELRRRASQTSPPSTLREALREASRRYERLVQSWPQEAQPRAGLVALLVQGGQLHVGTLGGGHVHLLREGQLLPLLAGPSPGLPRLGEASRLTGAVELEPEVRELPVQLRPGDVLLSCSASLAEVIPSEELPSLVQEALRGDRLEASCRQLVAVASARGARGGLSLQLARCGAPLGASGSTAPYVPSRTPQPPAAVVPRATPPLSAPYSATSRPSYAATPRPSYAATPRPSYAATPRPPYAAPLPPPRPGAATLPPAAAAPTATEPPAPLHGAAPTAPPPPSATAFPAAEALPASASAPPTPARAPAASGPLAAPALEAPPPPATTASSASTASTASTAPASLTTAPHTPQASPPDVVAFSAPPAPPLAPAPVVTAPVAPPVAAPVRESLVAAAPVAQSPAVISIAPPALPPPSPAEVAATAELGQRNRYGLLGLVTLLSGLVGFLGALLAWALLYRE